MHLPRLVQAPGQLAAGLHNGQPLGDRMGFPTLQPAVQITPTIQGTSQKDCALLARQPTLGKKRCLQGRNTELTVVFDIAQFAGEGRLAKQMTQTAGQVIALSLEVIGMLAQLQA